MKDESVKAKLNEYFARKSAVKSNLIIATVLLAIVLAFDFICALQPAYIAMEILLLAALGLSPCASSSIM